MAASNWLLDTSILVDLMRGSQSARDWIDSIPQDARAISVITAAELLAGCRNRAEQRTIERELGSYETTWLSEDISASALEYYKRFHLSHNIGFFDCLIAATALNNEMKLATLNLKHFLPFQPLQAKKPY